jgi:APA family basic amino acid/polyamine antiporter
LLLNFSRGLVAAYQFVLLIATLTAVIPYAFSAVASLILGMRDPEGSRTNNWPDVVVAVVAFAVCFWVIATSGVETVYWVFLLVMLGLPIYVIAARQKIEESNV